MDEFKSISVLERAFVKKYKLHTLIKEVRNRVGGHIHNDYCLWYETVVDLEPQYAADMTIAFLKAFSPIQHLTMKLAGFEHEKFLKHGNDSTKSVNHLLDKIENLTREVNDKQPDGMKLGFDMKVFLDMLKN
ncbi:hypothetical protein [Pedobacter sp. ASV28]|uniref:hypothetical protein n=1 Tax=Pedobacter sp. ASV28 TaxID=2795123 RepID=UPI0018EDD70B|nr:hypothetical protein [Pedobacter sp. ASV28]